MSEFDFEAELRRLYGSSASAVHYQSTDSALRRAYAAGQASGGGSDLDRLVALAATHPDWTEEHELLPQRVIDRIAVECVSMLSALKAQAVAK